MTSFKSLKARLIAMAILWITAGMIAAGLVLSTVFHQHVAAQFEEELFVHLSELQRLARIDPSGAALTRQLSDPRYDERNSGFYWEIQRGKSVVARSPSMEGPMLVTPVDEPKDVGVHTHRVQGPTGPLLVAEQAHWETPEGPVIRYLIGTDERHLDTIVASFNRTMGVSLAAFGAGLIGAAGLLIAFAMRPLDQLRAALREVRGGVKRRLDASFPSEVQPLVDDLNGLLGSTADLVQRARIQAGNVAHGLKTPLAILTDEAHRLEREGLTRQAATILAQLRNMQSHIDYQITRARAAAAHVTIGNAASVATALDEVTRAMQRLYRDRPVSVLAPSPEKLQVACDRQDLNEILANLLDNAFKHARSRIEIRTQEAPAVRCVTISIDDDGAGLPVEARDIVFNVGERWDSQEPGTGLGLAIARDLARLYGGDIRLEQSPLGGLRVLLTLPSIAGV